MPWHPLLRQRGYGGVLNVASMAGGYAIPLLLRVCCHQSLCAQLTGGTLKEYLNTGVHMVTLCPGPVDTEVF